MFVYQPISNDLPMTATLFGYTLIAFPAVEYDPLQNFPRNFHVPLHLSLDIVTVQQFGDDQVGSWNSSLVSKVSE